MSYAQRSYAMLVIKQWFYFVSLLSKPGREAVPLLRKPVREAIYDGNILRCACTCVAMVLLLLTNCCIRTYFANYPLHETVSNKLLRLHTQVTYLMTGFLSVTFSGKLGSVQS